MTIRLSQQYVDVAGAFTDGELRVYRQYVSVLTQGEAPTGNTFCESPSDTLSFTDAATGQLVYHLASTLNFADAVDYVGIISPSVLTLTDTAAYNLDRNLSANDVIAFSQVASKAIPVSADNTLLFEDEFLPDYIVEDRQVPYNTLNLTQTVQTLSSIELDQDLGLIQTVDVYNSSRPVHAENTLFLVDHTTTPYHMFVEDDLGIIDYGAIPIEYTFTDVLGITDEASMTGTEGVLAFVQTVTVGKSKVVSNTLNLTDTMTVTGIFMRSVNDTLGIGHTFTWIEDTPCNRKNYAPFYGENTIPGAVAPPSVTLPVAQANPVTDRFLLYTPARGPRTTTVSLRAPEMDNRDRNAYTRVTRETRGGKYVVFADPTWPKIRTMVVTIIGLLKADIDALQVFFQATLGQEIGVTDWEGRQWAGVVTNPEEPYVQDGRDSWTVTFSLEGELLEGYHPGTSDDNALTLNQTVSHTLV